MKRIEIYKYLSSIFSKKEVSNMIYPIDLSNDDRRELFFSLNKEQKRCVLERNFNMNPIDIGTYLYIINPNSKIIIGE